MNNYPIWWDTTVTIFNRHEDIQTQVIRWFKTTVESCFWKYTGDKITIGEVELETNNTICRIPKDDRFLEYYQWVEKPNDTMSNYFTLRPGDIIVKGDVSDTIDEYTSGQRSTDLLKKYKEMQGCITIQEVGINTGPGRCDEHYFVKGI